MQSLSELDRQLMQLQYSDFLMLNVHGKQQGIKHLAQIQQVYVMLALGFFAFVMAYFAQDRVIFSVAIVMGAGLLVMGLQAQRKSDERLLIIASALLALATIFTILYQFMWVSDVTQSSMIVCIVFTVGVLYFIGQANQIDASPIDLPPNLQQIYETTTKLLESQQPNKSNKLILIRQLTSQTKIWLRSDAPVMMSKEGVFFDASLTLSLVLQGSDTGSNSVSVLVNYGDVQVIGRISRYDWLRYLQFAS